MGFKDMVIKLGLDSSGLSKGADEADAKMGGLAGKASDFIDKWAGPAGVVTAITLAGKALFDLGSTWEAASADMAKATGKTGDELAGLNTSLKNLALRGLEQDLNEAAGAMASLSKSFGLMGDELETTTQLFGMFGDVTNTDMKQAVIETNDAMKQWGLTAEELPAYLDAITVATQKTNTTASEFNALMQRAAPIFKGFGLSAQDSLGVLASFEKLGVNSEKAIMSLQQALAKFSKEGKDAGTALREVFDQIKNLKDPADATALAVATFGQKTGVAMVAQIRDGTLSLEAMKKSLGDVEGALLKTDAAAGETGDKLKVAGNRIGAVFSDLGKTVSGGLGEGLDLISKGLASNQYQMELNLAMAQKDVPKIIAAYEKMGVVTSENITQVTKDLKEWARQSSVTSAEQLKALDAVDLAFTTLKAKLKDAASKPVTVAVDEKATKEEIAAWNAAYKAQKDYMHKLRMEDEADAKKVLEMKFQDEVKYINDNLGYGKEGAKEKAAALLIIQAKYDADLFKLKTEEEKKEKELRDKYAEYDKQANEEDIEGNQTMLDKMGEAWGEYYADLEKQSQNWGEVVKKISDSVTGALSNGLVALGEALYKGEAGWESMAKIALTALADILEAIGKQLAAMAVVNFANIPVAIALGAGAAAALIGAGVVRGMASGYEHGTTNAEAGMHEMAEAGPELIMKRGTYPLKGGETVLNAQDTARALGIGKEVIINIHSPRQLSIREASQQLTRVSRELRLEGVL